MFKFLFPREEDFFKLFQSAAAQNVAASLQFQQLLNQLDNITPFLNNIQKHEKEADTIITLTFERLHKTFITPFDRDDIHKFVKNLNSVIEAILGVADRIHIYKLRYIPEEIHTMAKFVVQSAEAIQQAAIDLPTLSRASSVLECCNQVIYFEGLAEQLLLSGVSRLFEEENDMKRLLQLKEIYEHTDNIMNENEAVANTIKDIVLEYS